MNSLMKVIVYVVLSFSGYVLGVSSERGSPKNYQEKFDVKVQDHDTWSDCKFTVRGENESILVYHEPGTWFHTDYACRALKNGVLIKVVEHAGKYYWTSGGDLNAFE